MSLFYNNYKRLVQENNDAYSEIPIKSYKVLDNMFKYLETFEVSLFELEVIKKDLIGLAKEADREGVAFVDKLGVPEKEFCDSLVKDGIRPSHLEHAIPVARTIAVVMFLCYTFFWLWQWMPAEYGVSVFVVEMGLAAWLFDCAMLRRLERKRKAYSFAGADKKKKTFYDLLMGLIIFLIIILELPGNIEFIIRGDGRVIFFILFMLSIAALFGNNYYWDKRSEEYDWR